MPIAAGEAEIYEWLDGIQLGKLTPLMLKLVDRAHEIPDLVLNDLTFVGIDPQTAQAVLNKAKQDAKFLRGSGQPRRPQPAPPTPASEDSLSPPVAGRVSPPRPRSNSGDNPLDRAPRATEQPIDWSGPREGHLEKKAQDSSMFGIVVDGSWQRRWFSLRDGVLSYYSPDRRDLKKRYRSFSCDTPPVRGRCTDFVFEVEVRDPTERGDKLLRLRAESAQEMNGWLMALDAHQAIRRTEPAKRRHPYAAQEPAEAKPHYMASGNRHIPASRPAASPVAAVRPVVPDVALPVVGHQPAPRDRATNLEIFKQALRQQSGVLASMVSRAQPSPQQPQLSPRRPDPTQQPLASPRQSAKMDFKQRLAACAEAGQQPPPEPTAYHQDPPAVPPLQFPQQAEMPTTQAGTPRAQPGLTLGQVQSRRSWSKQHRSSRFARHAVRACSRPA